MKLLPHLLVCLLLLLLTSCRSCPIDTCHVRKVHMHSGQKYRGQPLFKMQNPAVGQKIKTYNPKSGTHANDRSKTLK